eukprot:87509_1
MFLTSYSLLAGVYGHIFALKGIDFAAYGVFNPCKMVTIKQKIMMKHLYCKIIKISLVLLDFMSCVAKHIQNYINLTILLSSYSLLTRVYAHIFTLEGIDWVADNVFNVFKMVVYF